MLGSSANLSALVGGQTLHGFVVLERALALLRWHGVKLGEAISHALLGSLGKIVEAGFAIERLLLLSGRKIAVRVHPLSEVFAPAGGGTGFAALDGSETALGLRIGRDDGTIGGLLSTPGLLLRLLFGAGLLRRMLLRRWGGRWRPPHNGGGPSGPLLRSRSTTGDARRCEAGEASEEQSARWRRETHGNDHSSTPTKLNLQQRRKRPALPAAPISRGRWRCFGRPDHHTDIWRGAILNFADDERFYQSSLVSGTASFGGCLGGWGPGTVVRVGRRFV